MVPAEGFEPPTPRLRSGCSTAELCRPDARDGVCVSPLSRRALIAGLWAQFKDLARPTNPAIGNVCALAHPLAPRDPDRPATVAPRPLGRPPLCGAELGELARLLSPRVPEPARSAWVGSLAPPPRQAPAAQPARAPAPQAPRAVPSIRRHQVCRRAARSAASVPTRSRPRPRPDRAARARHAPSTRAPCRGRRVRSPRSRP